MNRSLVRLAIAAACLWATVLLAQEVAPFALPSSTSGAEAVLINPAAMVDLEGLHGYLGLQQLDQRTDWKHIDGEADRATQAPLASAWNLGDDWAVGIGEMEVFSGSSSFPMKNFTDSFRKFIFDVHEWRGAVAYRVSDEINVGVALRFLNADYSLGRDVKMTWEGPSPIVHWVIGAYSGDKDAWGFELSTLWKRPGFTLGIVLRPEVKFDYGYGDLSVDFAFPDVSDPNSLAILRTYYPAGGVITEAVLPLEARVAVTLAPMGPWRFSGELGWVQWSAWDTIALDYQNETVDPGSGGPIVSDIQLATHFQDAFSFTAMVSRTFDNAVEAYGRLGWQEAVCGDPAGATLRPNDGALVTLGGRYLWRFGEWHLGVDAFAAFGVYSSNSGFSMHRGLLGVGLSVAY